MNSSKLQNMIFETIKEMLEDEDFDIELLEDDNFKAYIAYISENKKSVIDWKDYNKDDDIKTDFVFCIWNDGKDIKYENIVEKIKDKMDNKYTNIKVFFVFYSLKDQLLFDSIIKGKDFKVKFKKDCRLKLSAKNLYFASMFLSTSELTDFEINIASRIRALETKRPPIEIDKDNKINMMGYVFNANLYDLVTIYNLLGDKLFTKNVRYSIGDELDVDLEIKNTLQKTPEEFWYLNNGITIVIQDKDFSLKKSRVLQVGYNDDKSISVINGAQTISASAEFFYSQDYSDIEKEAAKKAMVMLKVIHINLESESNNPNCNYKKICDKEIDKISISLNRQKPIKQDDIAYTMQFVHNINNLYEKNKTDNKYFSLVRRGEKINRGYYIIHFARAVMAYLVQKPGEARSNAAGDLLKITKKDEDIFEFEDTKIFRNEFNEDNSPYDISFNKFYKPVNFSIRLEEIYIESVKVISTSSDTENVVLKNGKWYFVAYIVYAINHNKNADFTNFNAYINDSNIDKIKDIITEFIVLFSKVIEEANRKVNANDFKKNELYDKFKEYENVGQSKDLKDSIKNFIQKVISTFSSNE